jgi:hypothetical protein
VKDRVLIPLVDVRESNLDKVLIGGRNKKGLFLEVHLI